MATTNNKLAFGASTAIVCTITSLATSSAREGTAVDNSTNLYFDALVSVVFTSITGSPASDLVVNVYAYGSEDGTIYGSPVTGTDASLGTLNTPTNLRSIGTISILSTSSNAERTYISNPMSVAQAFGGSLPRKWGIAVENRTGLAFSTSTASTAQKVSYSGVYTTSGG